MNDNSLLSALKQEGVLINVSIRFWRAARKLNAEDLGLEASEVNDRLISLGHKKLMPRDELKSFAILESRAHSLIEENTFPFLNGLGHFLPNRRLALVTRKLAELENEFAARTRSFQQQYPELRENSLGEWRQTASRLSVKDPEKLCSTIEAGFPSADQIGRYFSFDTQVFQIALPGKLSVTGTTLAEQMAVATVRENAAREAQEKLSAGIDAFVGDCVATLRQETARLCDDMLASIQQSESGVHQKTLNRLANFIDQFKAMNFVGDKELEKKLEATRKELLGTTAEEYRDSATAQARLRTGLQKLSAEARNLATRDAREIVERFGNLGTRRFDLAA